MGALSLVQMSPAQEEDGPPISQRISEEAIEVVTQKKAMYSKESDIFSMSLCAEHSTARESSSVWWSWWEGGGKWQLAVDDEPRLDRGGS